MKKLLFAAVLITSAVLFITGLQAQDIHYSQYNAAPMELNPALAGMNGCDYRLHANFRTQWVTVSDGNTYRTFGAGADMALGKVTRINSFAGLGLSFVTDQAGDLNFNTHRVDLSFAYHFMLNHKGTQQISVGIQGAFNAKTIDPSKATFDSQYDPSTGLVNPNGTRENFGRTKIFYGDAGLGLLYSITLRHNANFYIGFAANHLNQPKISFYPNGQDATTTNHERLYTKITFHGGASIPLSNRIFIMPNFMVLNQGPSYEFDLGLSFKSVLGNDHRNSTTFFYYGVQYRGLFDAVIANVKIEYKGLAIGLSYDVNISKLLPASKSIGAPEISLVYTGCARKKSHPGRCPDMF